MKYNDSFVLVFNILFWFVFKIDVMLNWYIVVDGLQVWIILSSVGEKFSFVGLFEIFKKWKCFLSDLYDLYILEKCLEFGFVKDFKRVLNIVIFIFVEVK